MFVNKVLYKVLLTLLGHDRMLSVMGVEVPSYPDGGGGVRPTGVRSTFVISDSGCCNLLSARSIISVPEIMQKLYVHNLR